MSVDRRHFLQLMGGAFGSALASALVSYPLAIKAATDNNDAVFLSEQEWQSLEAICEQILPPVNGVSTRQVQCVNFIDKLLANEERAMQPFYRQGMAAINAYAFEQWQKPLDGLLAEDQVAVLQRLEDGEIAAWTAEGIGQAELFSTLHFHTLLGFLAAPSHGGNKKELGWKAVGFPGHLHELGGISDEDVSGSKSG